MLAKPVALVVCAVALEALLAANCSATICAAISCANCVTISVYFRELRLAMMRSLKESSEASAINSSSRSGSREMSSASSPDGDNC